MGDTDRRVLLESVVVRACVSDDDDSAYIINEEEENSVTWVLSIAASPPDDRALGRGAPTTAARKRGAAEIDDSTAAGRLCPVLAFLIACITALVILLWTLREYLLLPLPRPR